MASIRTLIATCNVQYNGLLLTVELAYFSKDSLKGKSALEWYNRFYGSQPWQILVYPVNGDESISKFFNDEGMAMRTYSGLQSEVSFDGFI